MTVHSRMWLFLLCSLCTVIIPAVMVSTYHTLADAMNGLEPMIAVLALVPLVVVLLVCFIGLYVSLFRTRMLPKVDHCEKIACPNHPLHKSTDT